jgi:tRNA pseudouridine38-40 synthase
MRLRLTISYDGAPFLGWQNQLKGETVQGVIERAFFRIIGKRITVHGASRTDAGVHALAQCAHVDIPERRMDLSDWRRALNANLPEAVRILKVLQTTSSFHARFTSVGKIYRYRVWNSEVLPPLERGRVWHVPNFLDFRILCSNATLFEGRHNFISFSVNGREADSTLRTLHAVRISRHSGGEVRLTFEGDGFLYKMVRVLAGTLIRLGQRKEDVGQVARLLLDSSVERRKSLYIAPAQGLYLVRVLYGRKPKS